jgi:non-homologous end joining protein Ku
MRPYWKGYLKLALVSCPIALHAACSTTERIAFRQINKATGNRLRQQLIDVEKPENPSRPSTRAAATRSLGGSTSLSNVINLMEALRRSAQEDKRPAPTRKAAAAQSTGTPTRKRA